METYEEEIEALNLVYKNLYISKYGVWIRHYDSTNLYRDGASVNYEIDFNNIDHGILSQFNQAAEKAVRNPKNYFFCTECRASKLRENFEAQVFAGFYCKDCAAKPSIKNSIQASKRPGFYE